MRIINTGAFVAQYFYIEDHNFTIVEVDGVFTEPEEASLIYVAVAQRYSILFTTKASTDRNYGLVTIADQVLLDGIPDTLVLNQTNWLQYNSSATFDPVNVTLNIADENPAFDDYSLVPYDKQPLLENPTKIINLTVSMGILENGKPYAFFNDQTYVHPKVPSLYTALTAGELATNEAVYGEHTNSFVLNHLEVVEVTLTNNDGGSKFLSTIPTVCFCFRLLRNSLQLLSYTAPSTSIVHESIVLTASQVTPSIFISITSKSSAVIQPMVKTSTHSQITPYPQLSIPTTTPHSLSIQCAATL